MSKKVCVIGAGSAGIASLRALSKAGINCDCYEIGSDIGGNWRYNNDNGRSSAYASLHIDTSKSRMEYSELPMSESYPNFPHHTQVLEYFEQYVDKFNLRQHIIFRTRVTQVESTSDGTYNVTVQNVDTQESNTIHYAAVLVCNGHHWNPRMPAFPGEFNGDCVHSHYYREPDKYKGKRVLVIGIGNSGADLSCEISRHAAETYLSMRRNPRILPRYLLGRPLDKWASPVTSKLPFWMQKATYKILLKLALGEQTMYGLPNPDHEVLSEHPTVSSELLNIVAHGGMHIKPNVARFEDRTVYFVDGSRADIDAIVMATGYKITFPFLDAAEFNIIDNQVGLYRKIVSPDHPGLYFIGLIQPLGAIMPLAEQQANWVAELIGGQGKLPDKATMQKAVAADQKAITDRYVNSPRHTIQVDYYPYLRMIEKERQQSRRRA